MEIKTTRQIHNIPTYLSDPMKEWVAVHDVIKSIKSHYTDWKIEDITCNCSTCVAVRDSIVERDKLLAKLTPIIEQENRK